MTPLAGAGRDRRPWGSGGVEPRWVATGADWRTGDGRLGGYSRQPRQPTPQAMAAPCVRPQRFSARCWGDRSGSSSGRRHRKRPLLAVQENPISLDTIPGADEACGCRLRPASAAAAPVPTSDRPLAPGADAHRWSLESFRGHVEWGPLRVKQALVTSAHMTMYLFKSIGSARDALLMFFERR